MEKLENDQAALRTRAETLIICLGLSRVEVKLDPIPIVFDLWTHCSPDGALLLNVASWA
ncbi:hypothetical protein M2212_002890 [Bradyrhizobium elkanii]|uniref:hypothetical protein n=1 Tax=Bradyrhizobium elkanii TaxID=29448 RepID=UPI00209DD0AD|nr:hypothetical protein [Bradyrhizobium elkanii]MCP1926431.1 hypothetical protein [Bradyrhizobium elkanii]MCS3476044.1 hypothetical protein [Bradyrhizobium elkanii]